jgi:ABC-type transport system involved in Fe-S cluster assembly fused permease/ATPase subunit
MDRGTSSIGSLLSYIGLNIGRCLLIIVPVFIDMIVAVLYFIITFSWDVAIIIFTTMILYIFFTIWITEWRTRLRREMNDLEKTSRGKIG